MKTIKLNGTVDVPDDVNADDFAEKLFDSADPSLWEFFHLSAEEICRNRQYVHKTAENTMKQLALDADVDIWKNVDPDEFVSQIINSLDKSIWENCSISAEITDPGTERSMTKRIKLSGTFTVPKETDGDDFQDRLMESFGDLWDGCFVKTEEIAA